MKPGDVVRVSSGVLGPDGKELCFDGVIENPRDLGMRGTPSGCKGWILVRALGCDPAQRRFYHPRQLEPKEGGGA